MICAGIDVGSRAIKIVLLDAVTREVVAKGITDQGVGQEKIARELFMNMLSKNKIRRSDVGRVLATGYGRNIVSIADATVTEITCQAIGVGHLNLDAKTIIDIGGQDSKIICLDGKRLVKDFVMNDRCAAGTGRFLEVVASRLGITLGSFGRLAQKSKSPAIISSMCVVFAETEIIGLLAVGGRKEDIVAGVQTAVAGRVRAMAGQNIASPVILTGGVAMIFGMDTALASAVGTPVRVSPEPQMTCALGAAILAARQIKKANA
ncbi:MAG: acyl-CoA dehydratase activase [Sedimentisphaerales bacterium]|jgi:predicted CoA-substrate-specific enzyme activase